MKNFTLDPSKWQSDDSDFKGPIDYKLKGFPPEMNKTILVNSIKYKIYSAFTKKTPEEKQLIKMEKPDLIKFIIDKPPCKNEF